MNMTTDKRSTSNMRRLIRGDMFVEDGELWEVTGEPEKKGSDIVHVPLKRVSGRYTKRYAYPSSHRVRLVRTESGRASIFPKG